MMVGDIIYRVIFIYNRAIFIYNRAIFKFLEETWLDGRI